MNSINKLTELLGKFPGIGPRQAKRFAYFLITRNQSYLEELSRHIAEIKQDISECGSCHRFFEKSAAQALLCDICRSPNRDKSLLVVVSRDIDLENIEKAHVHNG